MKTQIYLMALAALVVAGCHKAEQIERANTAPLPKISVDGDAAKPADAPQQSAAAEPAEATAPVREKPGSTAPLAPGEEAPVGGRENMDLGLGSLNNALQDFLAAFDRPAKQLDELVQAKMIPRLPTPPVGKKYSIDTRKNKIILVNK